jgi:hypothetical protein
VAAAPRENGVFHPAPNAPRYSTFQLYDNRGDPHQLVNLAGHREVARIEADLRERLVARMKEAGDAPAQIDACAFPYA